MPEARFFQGLLFFLSTDSGLVRYIVQRYQEKEMNLQTNITHMLGVTALVTAMAIMPVNAAEDQTGKPKQIHIEKRASSWDKFEDMTPEERRAHWEKKHEKLLATMTPEQRDAFETLHRKRMEKWENMTAEEREQARQERRAIREKIRNMSPEERRAYRKQQHEEKLADLTPDQREAYKQWQQTRREEWKNKSPEERQAHREKWRDRLKNRQEEQQE